MKGRRLAILLIMFFSQFVFASLPRSICTVLYENEFGVRRVSFDCGKTFQAVGMTKTKHYYIVNWEKHDRIFQSLDGGRTWYELKRKEGARSENLMSFLLFGEQMRGITIEAEESSSGIITISDFLGNVLYNEAIYLNKGRNEIKLPFQFSRSGLYFGIIKTREKSYNLLLFNW